jgi:hypothetical protein
MKFNNRSKKSKEILGNTLGERENCLGFEDPEEKGSQIPLKPKGFGGGGPKLPWESLGHRKREMREVLQG